MLWIPWNNSKFFSVLIINPSPLSESPILWISWNNFEFFSVFIIKLIRANRLQTTSHEIVPSPLKPQGSSPSRLYAGKPISGSRLRQRRMGIERTSHNSRCGFFEQLRCHLDGFSLTY